MSNIYVKLLAVQNELNVPKNQVNKFWGYKYRSCEDIMEAVKPVLAKYELALYMSDTIELVWDRYYVKATATVVDLEDPNQIIYSTWYARETEEKKWMDQSQVSWASSSYARKYCLAWLLLADDTKDADAMDNTKVKTKNETDKLTFEYLKQSISESKDITTLQNVAKNITSAYKDWALQPEEQAELKELYNSKSKEIKW